MGRAVSVGEGQPTTTATRSARGPPGSQSADRRGRGAAAATDATCPAPRSDRARQPAPCRVSACRQAGADTCRQRECGGPAAVPSVAQHHRQEHGQSGHHTGGREGAGERRLAVPAVRAPHPQKQTKAPHRRRHRQPVDPDNRWCSHHADSGSPTSRLTVVTGSTTVSRPSDSAVACKAVPATSSATPPTHSRRPHSLRSNVRPSPRTGSLAAARCITTAAAPRHPAAATARAMTGNMSFHRRPKIGCGRPHP